MLHFEYTEPGSQVLVVDELVGIRESPARLLGGHGHEVVVAGEWAKACG